LLLLAIEITLPFCGCSSKGSAELLLKLCGTLLLIYPSLVQP